MSWWHWNMHFVHWINVAGRNALTVVRTSRKVKSFDWALKCHCSRSTHPCSISVGGNATMSCTVKLKSSLWQQMQPLFYQAFKYHILLIKKLICANTLEIPVLLYNRTGANVSLSHRNPAEVRWNLCLVAASGNATARDTAKPESSLWPHMNLFWVINLFLGIPQ